MLIASLLYWDGLNTYVFRASIKSISTVLLNESDLCLL